MQWNWEQKDWPEFSYNSKTLEALERQFLPQSGEFMGVFRHVGADDQNAMCIELISDEAVKTSEIEGEILNRDSVQFSLRHQFGLGPEDSNIRAAERGIASMMTDLYERFADPLDDWAMVAWHNHLLSGNNIIKAIGGYRIHSEPMQVVSDPIHKPTVHSEGPPSKFVSAEMQHFITWFNHTAPTGRTQLPALTRAGLVHLYFVCIHPFEDDNGRIGQALAEKSLAQNLGHPSLIALAYMIERKRKDYYAALEHNNKNIEVTDWLRYFAETVIEAQSTTIKRVDFYIAKAKFYERLRCQLNERQIKVIAVCSKRTSMGSRVVFQLKNTSRLREHRGPPRPAIFKTSWRSARSLRPVIYGTQDIS